MNESYAKGIIKDAGLRATPTRIAFLSVLISSEHPLTASTLLTKLKNEMDESTIFRNLNTFTTAGIIKQIFFQRGETSYEFIQNNDHHHIICQKCNKIEELKTCPFDSHLEGIYQSSVSFAQITDHQFELYGICNQCQQKSA
jgi:Fur family zinc uptake transcriptional regulator